MKKVVFFIDTMRRGGAERVMSILVNHFAKFNDYEVYLVCLLDYKIEYVLNDNIKIIYISDKILGQSRNILTRIKSIKQKIKKSKEILDFINPDLIVSFLPSSCFLALLNKGNRKVIISVRNDPRIEYKNLKNKILMRLLYPKADGAVFQTLEAADYFKNIIKCSNRVIKNPLDERFMFNNLRENKEKIIVTVGRLEEQKNQVLLIEAFKEFLDYEKDYQLLIYGEGREKGKLLSLVENLGLSNSVIFKGKVDDIQFEIKDATMFILTSNYEGMPNALIEAMALGLPCISTDCPCGGPREIITNMENGILIKVNDKKALVDNMIKISRSEKLQNKLSKNAVYVKKQFNQNIINEEWKEYIEEIMANK